MASTSDALTLWPHYVVWPAAEACRVQRVQFCAGRQAVAVFPCQHEVIDWVRNGVAAALRHCPRHSVATARRRPSPLAYQHVERRQKADAAPCPSGGGVCAATREARG